MTPALHRSSVIWRFEGSDAIEIHDGITLDFYMGLPCMRKEKEKNQTYCHPLRQCLKWSPPKQRTSGVSMFSSVTLWRTQVWILGCPRGGEFWTRGNTMSSSPTWEKSGTPVQGRYVCVLGRREGRGGEREGRRQDGGEGGNGVGWCVACVSPSSSFISFPSSHFSPPPLPLSLSPSSSFSSSPTFPPCPHFPLSLLLLSTSAPSQISGTTSEATARKCSS